MKVTGGARAPDHTITISEAFGVYWVDKRKLHTTAKKTVQISPNQKLLPAMSCWLAQMPRTMPSRPKEIVTRILKIRQP